MKNSMIDFKVIYSLYYQIKIFAVKDQKVILNSLRLINFLTYYMFNFSNL
jgi:hypothetical protein